MGFSWICETGDSNSCDFSSLISMNQSAAWDLLAGSTFGSASAEMDWQLSDVPGRKRTLSL